jgi:hypothetical protein
MNKFNKKVNEILNEGILGNIANVANAGITAAGTALKTMENPAQGVSNLVGDLRSYSNRKDIEKEKNMGTVISKANPPKKGTIVVTKTPILGTETPKRNPYYDPDILTRNPNATPKQVQDASMEFYPSKIITLVPNQTIYGKITQEWNNKDSTYGVALTDEKGNPSQKYVFAQVQDAPYFQIFDSSRLPDEIVLQDEKGILMKLTAIKTGPAAENVSQPLRDWVDYKGYIEREKRLPRF